MAAKAVRKRSSTKIWWMLGGGVVVAVAAVWGISAGGKAEEEGVQIPEEFTVDALKARTEEGPRFAEFRETLEREDLNDDQKRQIVRNMGEVRRSQFQARVDEYFNAPPEEQTAILDRHIDEMQKMFQQFGREGGQPGNRRDRGAEEGPSQADRENMRRLMEPQSQQERKARSESRNPDEVARTVAYFGAMRSRASERGIQMPRGPRGGGPGGGRGGLHGP